MTTAECEQMIRNWILERIQIELDHGSDREYIRDALSGVIPSSSGSRRVDLGIVDSNGSGPTEWSACWKENRFGRRSGRCNHV